MTDTVFTAAAAVADVPPGTKKLVTVNGVDVLLCNSNDRVFAVENLCSHAEESSIAGVCAQAGSPARSTARGSILPLARR